EHWALYQNALHRDATLPGVGKASSDAAASGIFQIRVTVNDNAGVAPQFEGHFFLSGAALDVPAHWPASREADQLDALVTHQQPRILIGEWQNIQRTVGPSRLLHS